MPSESGFEKQWLAKLKNGLQKLSKADLFDEILKINENCSLIEWTNNLMTELNDNLSQQEINKIMTDCACTTPKQNLEIVRNEYAKTKDLNETHRMLQNVFERFIKQYKNLNEKQMEFIRANGWGMAGKLDGNTICATKIPKEIHDYFKTTDELKKKYYYCHCPRIRDLFLSNEKTLNVNYCYCGAGFYKDLWEYILNKKVRVEIIESVMKGDDVCKIAIYV